MTPHHSTTVISMLAADGTVRKGQPTNNCRGESQQHWKSCITLSLVASPLVRPILSNKFQHVCSRSLIITQISEWICCTPELLHNETGGSPQGIPGPRSKSPSQAPEPADETAVRTTPRLTPPQRHLDVLEIMLQGHLIPASLMR
jgi:hypothetical protein